MLKRFEKYFWYFLIMHFEDFTITTGPNPP